MYNQGRKGAHQEDAVLVGESSLSRQTTYSHFLLSKTKPRLSTHSLLFLYLPILLNKILPSTSKISREEVTHKKICIEKNTVSASFLHCLFITELSI